jgi:hypothetical protein
MNVLWIALSIHEKKKYKNIKNNYNKKKNILSSIILSFL